MKYLLSSLLALSMYGSYNLAEAQQYVEKNCSLWVGCRDIVSYTKAGVYEEVKKYVDSGQNLYVQDDQGRKFTLLHVSAWEGYLEISKLLFQAGTAKQFAFAEIKNSRGRTALHNATIRNNRTIVKFLLEQGVNVNVQDNAGNTPAHYAAAKSNVAMMGLLMQIGNANLDIRNNEGKTAGELWNKVTKDAAE